MKSKAHDSDPLFDVDLFDVDIAIVGAGPVGLLCAYLSHLCGLSTVIIDKSNKPLEVGRADALNARTLQLLEVTNLFDEFYPLGKTCNTSSVWKDGQFVSRQSSWWDDLEGCLHKHFLMIGQSFVEQLLDRKLQAAGRPVRRATTVTDMHVGADHCRLNLSSGELVRSRYLIGADGSRSFVRQQLKIPFEITRPEIVWAVIDGVIDTDFPKVPEIIVFQAETSDVAWIPREGEIDRFYIRMDRKDFSMDEAIAKINRAMNPHHVKFREIVWSSQFSVKESVAESFSSQGRAFLAGDACHIHSVNGGQGLNTGLADAYNLIWKMHQVIQGIAPEELLATYEAERKPVARSVIEASGELVRSTKFSESGTHAEDYVKIVERRAGNITGMGIHYADQMEGATTPLAGHRLHDMWVSSAGQKQRLYSLLDYSKTSLLIFGDAGGMVKTPAHFQQLVVVPEVVGPYTGQALIVRPDGYIADCAPISELDVLMARVAPLDQDLARKQA